MTEAAKLTKKQKKALEFRNKTGKEEKKSVIDQEDVIDSPIKEELQSETPSKKSKGKEKQKTDEKVEKIQDNKRKRKADDVEGGESSTKKKFDEEGNIIESSEKKVKPLSGSIQKDSNVGKRFIVFVGNMSFKTTSEEIQKHFMEHCDEKPNVRLLTTKGDPKKLKELSKSKQKSIAKGKSSDPSAPQSKGCAFVEFVSRQAMQKALQFHHTKLHGRSINVELTAGGGGAGAERKEKIAKKNKELDAERKKLHEKYVKDANKKKEGDEGVEKQKEQENKPQWGPNANQSRPTTKIPRWAATGANAVRLHT